MFELERKEIDSITFGDTKYRLTESENGKRVIELYSSLSKRWNVSARHNVNEQWNKMKVLYEGMAIKRNQNK